MEISTVQTSVSSYFYIALVLVSSVILRPNYAFSLPLSSETTAEDHTLEDIAPDIDIICKPQHPVLKLKQLSLYSTDCKSEDKEFWLRNCRCSYSSQEKNCPPPKCPQEMATSTAKTTLPTTTLLSTLLLSSLSPTSTGPTSTSSMKASISNSPTINNSLVTTTIASISTSQSPTSTSHPTSGSGPTSSSVNNTTKSHGEELLPTPSKLVVVSNNNFIRLG